MVEEKRMVCRDCGKVLRSIVERKYGKHKRCGIYYNPKDICTAEVKKNIVLAELGEPLTLPLAMLNNVCEFNREWNRIQKKWNRNKYPCKECGKEFMVSKGRYKYCSKDCANKHKIKSEILKKKRVCVFCKKTFQTNLKLHKYCSVNCRNNCQEQKKKAYSQTPEVKAKKKAYRQTPEAKARTKEYYKKNREEILRKLKERRTTKYKPEANNG